MQKFQTLDLAISILQKRLYEFEVKYPDSEPFFRILIYPKYKNRQSPLKSSFNTLPLTSWRSNIPVLENKQAEGDCEDRNEHDVRVNMTRVRTTTERISRSHSDLRPKIKTTMIEEKTESVKMIIDGVVNGEIFELEHPYEIATTVRCDIKGERGVVYQEKFYNINDFSQFQEVRSPYEEMMCKSQSKLLDYEKIMNKRLQEVVEEYNQMKMNLKSIFEQSSMAQCELIDLNETLDKFKLENSKLKQENKDLIALKLKLKQQFQGNTEDEKDNIISILKEYYDFNQYAKSFDEYRLPRQLLTSMLWAGDKPKRKKHQQKYPKITDIFKK